MEYIVQDVMAGDSDDILKEQFRDALVKLIDERIAASKG